MTTKTEIAWAKVEGALVGANSIAFDGCHKIYVLMDDTQTRTMSGYGYGEDGSSLRTSEELDPAQMLSTLRDWYDQSCGLRFISAVKTVSGNPNDGFTNLISQFEDDDKDED